MKKQLVTFLICLFTVLNVYSQNSSGEILSKAETTQLFSESVKKKFNIQYPIRRVYAYNDNSGEYRVAISESFNGIYEGEKYNNLYPGDTLHRQIKAFLFRLSGDTLVKVRETYDYTDHNEVSIWFWTKYCEFSDIDGDGLVEPIIIYGTEGDWPDSFRVKILTWYKNKKYAIRHHNCILDDCRITEIDESFYNLPESIQEHVKNIIKTIEERGHAYFGHWENAMNENVDNGLEFSNKFDW